MKAWVQVLQHLADGRFHSGEELAFALGCSRSAVWKQLQNIRQLPGIEVDSVKGKGYRLSRPLDLLQEDVLLARLSETNRTRLGACNVLHTVDSTNALAMDERLQRSGQAMAWFAELQTAGRGRRGRPWVSSFGDNIYFSLAYRFDLAMGQLAGLSVATGAVLVQLLREYGLTGHGLKWPNDIHWEGRKLAGILLEAHGETDGPSTAVIGIGVNLRLDKRVAEGIDQPCATLEDAGLLIDRSHFAGDLLNTVISMCEQYQGNGLEPFLQIWRDNDLYKGKEVALLGPNNEIRGINEGLADNGGLSLSVNGVSKTYFAGELSLRPTDEVDRV